MRASWWSPALLSALTLCGAWAGSVALRAEPGKLTARELANRYPSAAACEQGARAMKAEKPDPAWALLAACSQRKDFEELTALLGEAWSAELKARPNGMAVLAEALGNRRKSWAEDLVTAQGAGMPIKTLDAALGSLKADGAGAHVFFSAVVTQMGSTQSGYFEVALDQYAAPPLRKGAKPGASAGPEVPSGVTVVAYFRQPVKFFREGDPILVYARLQKVAPRKDDADNLNAEELPHIELVKAWRR